MIRRLAIVTEESTTFGQERGRAVDIFEGSFKTVRNTVQIFTDRGIKTDLFILTSKFGLIPSAKVIDRYEPLSQSQLLNLNLEGITREVCEVLDHYEAILFMLSLNYALLISQAIATLKKSQPVTPNRVSFIVSGKHGIEALSEAMKARSSQLLAYHRIGVARIAQDARADIIARLTGARV